MISFEEQSPAEKQNKYSHNSSKSQNQFPKNARISNKNLRFFVVVYGLFDARDGIWGSEGIWAEKDPTREEWGKFYSKFFYSSFLSYPLHSSL